MSALPPRRAKALQLICAGVCTIRSLAAAMGIVKSVACMHVGRLADAGYVSCAQDITDRRSVLIKPTRSGRAVLAKAG